MSDYIKINELDPATEPLSGAELIELDVGAGVPGRKITIAALLNTFFRLGDTVISSTPKLGAAAGLLAWGCDKVATTGTYAALYAVVADRFETARVAAGWAASGAGYFYPSPPAGYFPRPAYPDFEFTYNEVNVDDTIDYTACPYREGTPVLYEEGTDPITGLADDTVYYITNVTANEFELATTEALAVAGTAVNITAVGTGTGHKLIFAYQLEEDALQGFQVGAAADTTGARDYWSYSRLRDHTSGLVADPNRAMAYLDTGAQGSALMEKAMNDGTNGDPRTTNETRPAQIGMYFYIRALLLL